MKRYAVTYVLNGHLMEVTFKARTARATLAMFRLHRPTGRLVRLRSVR